MSTRTRANQEQVTQRLHRHRQRYARLKGIRDKDVEDDEQNRADLHIHKDKYVVVSYA